MVDIYTPQDLMTQVRFPQYPGRRAQALSGLMHEVFAAVL